MIKALYRYRGYIWSNSVADLKYRYAGSAMGVVWHVLTPLLQILVYTFVFTEIMSSRLPNMDSAASFSLYLCSGMFAWFAFSECLTRGTNAFIESSAFLKKLPVPEVVFVAQKIVASYLTCTLTYTLIVFYAWAVLGSVTIYWLLVPLILGFLLLMAFGLAMILASINVFFKDTVQLVNIFLLVWLWLTPIVYVEDIIPDRFLLFMKINPVYVFINALHNIILYNAPPSLFNWAQMVGFSVVMVLIGNWVMKKLISDIRDML